MPARTRTAQPASEVDKPARKAAAKKATKKSSGSTTSARPAEPARSGTGSAPAKRTAKKAATKKAPAAKSAPAKTAPAKTAPAKAATKASGAAKGAAKKTPTKAPARSRLSAADRKEFTELITAELARVRGEYDQAMVILDELKNAGQDSAGDDPADAGAKTFEREQEMSLANNRLDLMAQMERAMRRVEEGTYGICESCGKQIPKARLQAFPQATLCVDCKSREERR